jgi:AcrR family transcriptional regulator
MTVLADLELRPGRAGDGGPGVDQRATAALLACVARFGLSKTTLDDVAREAGCSRATLYRYFDGKAALVRRAVDVELERLTTRAVDAAGAQDELFDATLALVVTAARDLVAHRPLQFLLAHEPESILGQLAFGPGDRLLVRVGDAFAPAFGRWFDLADARRAGDWIARVLRSYVLMPEPSIDLTDVAAACDFLRELVVPAFEPSRRNR